MSGRERAGAAPAFRAGTRTAAAAFAPATVANVAVGFDLLGFALAAPGDRVAVTRLEGPAPVAVSAVTAADTVTGAEADAVPLQPDANTAAVALTAMIEGLGLPFGFSVAVEKGIPLGSGLGGSAASAVGAVVAAAALLDPVPPPERLLPFALAGEAAASGAPHPDNAAPCLFGGLVLALPGDPPRAVRVPVPAGLVCVTARPHRRLDTREARAALAETVPLAGHVAQSGRLARLLAACYTGDFDLLRGALEDVLIEPQRAALVPGFDRAQRAALEAGAIGCSLSGSGPSVFAWTEGPDAARRVEAALRGAFAASGSEVSTWTGPVGAPGARVEDP